VKIAIADTFWKGFKKVCRPWWHPANLWYRFKCWAWHRYSTVKPRYLPHTWCDRSHLLFHAMFEILSDFRDGECNPGHVAWYDSEWAHKVTVNGEEKFVRDEIEDIYNWWHNNFQKDYPAQEDALYEKLLAHDDAHKLSDFTKQGDLTIFRPRYDSEEAAAEAKRIREQIHLLEQDYDEQLQEYMHRLVNIRRSLWT